MQVPIGGTAFIIHRASFGVSSSALAEVVLYGRVEILLGDGQGVSAELTVIGHLLHEIAGVAEPQRSTGWPVVPREQLVY